MAAIDRNNFLLMAGFEELPVNSETLELYRLRYRTDERVKSAKQAVLQTASTEHLTYQGDIEKFTQRIQEAPYLVKSTDCLKLIDAELLGTIYENCQQYVEAIGYYYKSTCGKTAEEQSPLGAKVNANYRKLDDRTKGLLSQLRKFTEKLPRITSQFMRAHVLKIAHLSYSIAKAEKSFIHYDLALHWFNMLIKNVEGQEAPSVQDEKCRAVACMQMAEIYQFSEDCEIAKQYRSAGLAYAKRLKNSGNSRLAPSAQ